MKACFVFLFVCVLFSCSTTRYYIVRHAEKESTSTMSTNVPLSEAGKQRATALKEVLLHKKITHIFSTNFKRTEATAEPLATATGIAIEHYDAADSGFITRLKQTTTGNTLIVGHSNTVDDLVNGLTGKNLLQDLPDSAYGDLFIVTKHGKRFSYSKEHFGL